MTPRLFRTETVTLKKKKKSCCRPDGFTGEFHPRPKEHESSRSPEKLKREDALPSWPARARHQSGAKTRRETTARAQRPPRARRPRSPTERQHPARGGTLQGPHTVTRWGPCQGSTQDKSIAVTHRALKEWVPETTRSSHDAEKAFLHRDTDHVRKNPQRTPQWSRADSKSALTTSVQQEILARAIRQDKEMQGTQAGKKERNYRLYR